MKTILNIFSELNKIFTEGIPAKVSTLAIEQNGWFSHSEISLAVGAIAEEMLSQDKLQRWLSGYKRATKMESVLIIMAGNIPLVGFSDLLCTLAAGDRAIVKPSHKDRVLMEWVIGELRKIEPDIPINIYKEGDQIDRLIATGGEAAVRYFERKYSNIPMLLRGSRHSVAVIEGEFEGLQEDIFSYSGLGCRNVSMIFAPKGFKLEQLPTSSVNPKQRNSYLRQRALHTLNNEPHFNSGTHCITESSDFPREVGSLTLFSYDNLDQVREWIALHDREIQCIVASETTISHPRRVGFGRAQHPSLWDYADGVDTMDFLLK